MRVGVFTPLLSQLPLAAVLKKLKSLQIETIELARELSRRRALQVIDARRWCRVASLRRFWPITGPRSARELSWQRAASG